MKVKLYSKQTSTLLQHKIIDDDCTSNHRLAIELDIWSTIPIMRDNKLYDICSYNVVENEAQFVLECPFYNLSEDTIPSL